VAVAWAFSLGKRQEKIMEKNVDQPKVARASP
jgi:hypothetical protein